MWSFDIGITWTELNISTKMPIAISRKWIHGHTKYFAIFLSLSIVISFELFSNRIDQFSVQFNWMLMHFLSHFFIIIIIISLSFVILGFFHLIPFIIWFVHCTQFHNAWQNVGWERYFTKATKMYKLHCCVYTTISYTVVSIVTSIIEAIIAIIHRYI